MKQTRMRFSGSGEAGRAQSGRQRRLSSQIPQSFTEKKRSQNWFQRQFMRETSQDFSFIDTEQATAVAAATYAINSLEESGTTDPENAREYPQMPLARIKSRKEDRTVSATEPGKQSKKLTGEPSFTESKETKPAQNEYLKKGKRPSIKRTPSLAERFSESLADSKAEDRVSEPNQHGLEPANAFTVVFEGELPKQPSMKLESNVPKYEQPTKPRLPPTSTQRQSPTKSRNIKKGADAWEEEELTKIKERYEKLNATIIGWESNKKEKASKKLNKKQSNLEGKRAKDMEEFNSEIRRITKIAGEARSQAEERRKKEELKAKEKADKMRITGKVPKSCFCC